MTKSICVLMAHADDIELSAGGTLAKYISKGYRALYGVLTRCNSGWSEDADGGRYQPSQVIIPRRRAEAEAAARAFGAEVFFGTALENYYTCTDGKGVMPSYTGAAAEGASPDDVLPGRPIITASGAGFSEPSPELAKVRDLLIEWQPEIVICQSFQCWNPDHYAAALMLLKGWMMALEKVDVGDFWIPLRVTGKDWPDFPPMTPNHFEDVSGFEDTALAALACHVSQGMALERNQDMLRNKWSEWGKRAGFTSAEAFVRLKPFRKQS